MWNEKDVDGELSQKGSAPCLVILLPLGLIRTCDSLLAQQRELSKQKPCGRTDGVNFWDLKAGVGHHCCERWPCQFEFGNFQQFANKSLCQRACKLRVNGIKDELKHIDRELKNLSPELKKVGICSGQKSSYLSIGRPKLHTKHYKGGLLSLLQLWTLRRIVYLPFSAEKSEYPTFGSKRNDNLRLHKRRVKHVWDLTLRLRDWQTSVFCFTSNSGWSLNHSRRADFESEGLKQADERLVRLETIVQAEQVYLEKARSPKDCSRKWYQRSWSEYLGS